MRTRVAGLLGFLLLTLAHTSTCRALDNLAAQERLGVRIGYIETFNGVYEYYGPGWDVTLYFNERIYSRLYFDIHIGAIYYGDILDEELDDFITRIDEMESEMRTFYFSVGFGYGFPIGSGTYTLTTSAAAGVYSASVALASDFVSDDLSDQYFGGNASIGIMRRIATNWVLELNGTVHYFDTEPNYGDLMWVFTAGTAEDPVLVGVSLGLAIDLR